MNKKIRMYGVRLVRETVTFEDHNETVTQGTNRRILVCYSCLSRVEMQDEFCGRCGNKLVIE